ncbi:autotransporter outer membrane beta-barrel domain-containing protein [Rickettsia endosymbiont of Halotydeus destructor]|uniref:autotransporter outer membrane beta-barrel domain-containing protein n=1 Tax=Rickettsia endosymbiont of Halotydeus destructor TaxID=2996754 RepID=UPI003BAF8FDB
MTDNSSKFFRKILKNSFLVTASGATIMLSSGGALAAAIDVNGTAALLQGDNSKGALSANFSTGANLTLTGPYDLSTAGKVTVGSVTIGANNGQTFTFNRQASVGGDLDMNVIVNTGGAVTLGNVIAAGGGPSNITVNDGTLTLGNAAQNMTITGGKVTQTGIISGDLNVSGNGNLTGAATDVTGTVTLADNAAVTIHDALNATPVSIAGGTLTINNANNGIKFTGAATAATTVNILDGGNAGVVSSDTANPGKGKLVFQGDGAVASISAGVGDQAIAEVDFNGINTKTVAIAGAANAETFKIDAGKVTAGGAVNGTTIQYTAAGTWEANAGTTANIDFNGQDGIFQVADGQNITGTVDSSTGAGNLGNLILQGVNTVTGAVGATKAPKTVQVGAGNGQTATFNSSVTTQTLQFNQAAANVAGTVAITGNFTGAVSFTANAKGGILQLDGGGTIGAITANGGNGKIAVNSAVTATDASIGTIGNVTIANNQAFTVDANKADVANLLSVADQFTFSGANSQLVLTNSSTTDDRTITLNNNLDPAGNVGIVTLKANTVGGGGDIKSLTVSGTGATTLGTAGNKLKQLNVTGLITVTGVNAGVFGDDKLDVSNADVLNVNAGAKFLDESGTSGSIATINVGNGATHTLDISTAGAGPINLLDAGGGNVLTLGKANSTFTLQTAGAGAQQVVFKNHVVGNAAGSIVNLRGGAADILTVSGLGGAKIGNAANLTALNIAGKVTIDGDYAGGSVLDVSGSNLLNVYKAAEVIDNSGTSGTIKKINIGTADPTILGGVAGAAKYTLDVSTFATANAGAAKSINLLDAAAGNVLSFLDPASEVTIKNTAAANQTVVFKNHVKGIAGAGGAGGGIFNITGPGGAANTLTVSGENAGQAQLGNANNLAQLNITGNVKFTGNYTADATYNAIKVVGTDLLTIANGAVFTDESGTSGVAKAINVGEVGGLGKYILDVSSFATANAGGPIPINLLDATDAANVLTFTNAGSVFTIKNTAAADQTVVFKNHVKGVNPGNGGIFNITGPGGANTLTVSGENAGRAQLGNTNTLTALNIAGNVTITGNPTAGAATYNKLDISGTPILNVYNGALSIDESATSATIAEINIGADPLGGAATGPATHAIDVSWAGGAKDLATVVDSYKFKDAGSIFEIRNLANAQDTVVTLKNSINGGVGGVGDGGIIRLRSRADVAGPPIVPGNTLTLQGDGPQTLGTGGNKLSGLGVSGNVKIVGGANGVDISNTPVLDVYNGARFIDESGTSATIAAINIGAADPTIKGAIVGAASHTIDAVNAGANLNILQAGKTINFLHKDSVLVLQNSANDSKMITLNQAIDPGANDKGIVTINSVVATKTLTIAKAGGAANITLGTAVNKLNALAFTGAGKFAIQPEIFTTDFILGVPEATLGTINGDLTFASNTKLTENGNITGNVNFANQAAVITLGNGNFVGGSVTSIDPVSKAVAANGTIVLNGGYVGGNINGLALLQVGAGGGELKTGGPIAITNIQGTGTDTLILPANFILTGDINNGAGTAFKPNFTNGGSVTGTMGTQANPIGGLTTNGVTNFASAVFSNGASSINDTTTFANSFNNTGDVSINGMNTFTGAYTNTGGNTTIGGTTNFLSTFNNTGGATATSGTTTYTGAFNNTGVTTLADTTSFADTFTNQGAVTLVPQSINNFAKDVTATSFKADDATMNFGNSLAFKSDITGSGTTITLGSGQISYTGEASFTNELTLNTNFDGAANTGGNILITGAGSKMDLSGVTKLKVVISTTNFDLNNINPNTQYTLMSTADGGVLKQLLSANAIETDIGAQENLFLKWNLNPTSLVLSPSIVEDINNRIEEEITTGDLRTAPQGVKTDLKALETATDPNSEGFKFKVTMGFILDNEELTTKVSKAVGDSQDQVPSSDVANNTTVAITNTVLNNAVGSSLNSRMNSLQATSQPIAVSSGEEDEAKFGVWATPFVGNSTQKMRNNINGNKANFSGATVGFDGMLRDDLVLGVAYTKADAKIKQKNDKIGDSSKVKSNIYSIYGLYNLPTSNLFFQAIGSYSDSKIKNYSQRYQPVARNTIVREIANGNYKSRGFTGQIMAGYDYVAPQAFKLTPMIGLRYSKIKDSGYTETGTALQNLTVKGKNYNLVNGLAGVKVSKDINTGHMILIPEIYGMLDYGFKNKLPTPDARLQGMTVPYEAKRYKPVKTNFNIGAGITAKYKMMEYGINYDTNIASKYFAQQGSLKIRVNF